VDHRVTFPPSTPGLADIDAVCDLAALGDDVRHLNILANYQSVRALGLRAVLNGQGADEIMGGYVGRPNFIAHIMDVRDPDDARIRGLPASRQAEDLSPEVLRHREAADDEVLTFLHQLPGPGLERAHRLLLHTQLARVVQFEDYLSMRCSVEARFPFLDHRVVEWCFSRPFGAHVTAPSREGKVLLRQGLRAELPAALLARPKAVFPYLSSVALRAHLVALAGVHETEIRADPLVDHLFSLPRQGDLASLSLGSLWQIMAMWRWHEQLRMAAHGRSSPLQFAETGGNQL
jgi:asparagine synthase (glutamine-hydrolysing)